MSDQRRRELVDGDQRSLHGRILAAWAIRVGQMTDNPLQNVTFASDGHQAHGYLVKPPSGSGPGLIVIQEWWGLTNQIARTADGLAEQGFVCLAPDLYGGRTTHE